MNDTPLDTQQEFNYAQPPRRNPKRSKLRIFAYILLLLCSLSLWGGLLYGGYYYMNQKLVESKEYFDSQIEEIQQQNVEEITSLEEKLDSTYNELLNVKNELILVQEDLSLTGETLNGTDQTKLALQIRIDELNRQLKDLQASIKRLEDATNN